VGSKRYREQRITLKNKSHVNPDPQQQARFEREYEEQMQAYASFRTEGPSNVVFEKPVPGRLTSPFGLRRFFNGEERNPHSGLDFAAPTGTAVKVPADGIVTIVADYFFNGKTVFVDHGQGLITMFCHLSAFDVRVGDRVSKGDVVARSGATGRATGPHLHWNVSLNNARVDPAIFIGAFQA
jgi:murein DD-endopeptidase MepM/ murein hydrolase activator NlpD